MYSRTKLVLNLLLVIIALVGAMIECGCERDKKEDPSPVNFSYTINWDNAFGDFPKPQKLRYCFYPVGGSAMLRTDATSDEFQISLPADKYNVLVFNYDATNVEFNHLESFDKAEARLMTATRAVGSEMSSATPLYGLVINNLEVKPGQEVADVLRPAPLVKQISFDINVEGSGYINNCKGSLSGMASALSLSKHLVIPEEPVIVTMETSLTDKGVRATAMVLGVAASGGGDIPAPTNQLILDFAMKDGSTVTATADLGHSLTETTGPDVHVDVEATASPSPVFNVTLKSWKIASGDSMIIK